VIGSRNSSNSVRLVEVARDFGIESHLIDTAAEIREEWLDGAHVVGISSGASAPENLVQDLVQLFRDRGVTDISEFHVIREDVRFMLPKTIREATTAGEQHSGVQAGALPLTGTSRRLKHERTARSDPGHHRGTGDPREDKVQESIGSP